MNIEEGNKILAEFMRLPCSLSFFNQEYTLENIKLSTNLSLFWHEETGSAMQGLRYHKDWNWLMKAVRRIIYIANEDDLTNSDVYRSIWYTVPHAEIESSYKAVVDFIKAYNESKNECE